MSRPLCAHEGRDLFRLQYIASCTIPPRGRRGVVWSCDLTSGNIAQVDRKRSPRKSDHGDLNGFLTGRVGRVELLILSA